MENSNPTIIHAIDTTGPGGAETVFLDIAQQLHLPGYRNLAIIKGAGWVEDQLQARGVEYRIVTPRGFLSIPYYLELFKLLKKQNVALIHAHLLGSTLTYSILSLLLKLPLVATIHGRVDINPNERFVAIKQFIMKHGVNRLIAVSKDLANYIHTRNLFNKNDIDVIYNGIDVSKYSSSAAVQCESRFGLPEDALILGALGNIRPAKDYKNAISALALLTNTSEFSDRPIHFVIAGHIKKDLHSNLLTHADELGVADKIHFLGFQQDTAAYLACIDVFVLSSKSEGFSIATIEAMAAEKPVVATRCGGPEEILTHSVNGHLVAAENSAALADGLRYLISQPHYANQLVIAAKNHVRQNFSLNAMLIFYTAHYQQLLKRQNANTHTEIKRDA